MSIDGGLRQLFQEHLPHFHWQSIETGMTGRGIPDSNYCVRGVEGWVEFKITQGYSVSLRPEQCAWLHRRARAGGRVFVAVRRKCNAGPRRGRADDLWLLDGRYAPDIKTRGLRGSNEAVLGRWMSGPAHWDWAGVEGVLTRSAV